MPRPARDPSPKKAISVSIPLTVLGGAATALRDDLLRCLVLRRPGMTAVRYDVLSENGRIGLRRVVREASGSRSVELPLTDCCLSCTVRDDSAPTLTALAYEEPTELVLALPACLAADSLQGTLDHLPGVDRPGVTMLLDAPLLLSLVTGSDRLLDRGLAAAPTDGRSTAELICSQLEQADVLGAAGLDRLGTDRARTAGALLAHLAPLARQVVLGPGGAGCDDLIGGPITTRADHERLSVLAADLCPPACGVQTVRWRETQPLHPERLRAAMPALVTGCVRGRGQLLLAGRAEHAVRWSSAGGILTLQEQPWDGEPASDLLLTGLGMDASALHARLDSCVASEIELGQPLADPFAETLGAAHGP